MPDRFSEYHGVWLYTPQARALQDLESMLNTPIPDISNNSMGSFGYIHENYNVKELRLFQSYFEESVKLLELPESIGNLIEIHTLDVSHNKLTDLPDSIAELVELEKFYLDYNNFGRIPPILSTLEELRQLNFDENQLHAIPNSIHETPYLQSLHLAGNFLRKFPIELADLRYLRRLVLNRNRITNLDYTILDQFSRLYVLDLRANPIPQEQMGKALAFLKLSGKKRRKYYLETSLNPYENPFSIRNISKRIRSDPHLQFDKSDDEKIHNLAVVIKNRHDGRYETSLKDQVINKN